MNEDIFLIILFIIYIFSVLYCLIYGTLFMKVTCLLSFIYVFIF